VHEKQDAWTKHAQSKIIKPVMKPVKSVRKPRHYTSGEHGKAKICQSNGEREQQQQQQVHETSP